MPIPPVPFAINRYCGSKLSVYGTRKRCKRVINKVYSLDIANYYFTAVWAPRGLAKILINC